MSMTTGPSDAWARDVKHLADHRAEPGGVMTECGYAFEQWRVMPTVSLKGISADEMRRHLAGQHERAPIPSGRYCGNSVGRARPRR
jgi:hypothetical protein